MKLFLISFFCFSQLLYSQNDTKEIIYLDLSVDYENQYNQIFNFLSNKISDQSILVIPNGTKPHIQPLTTNDELTDFKNIFDRNWAYPMNDNTILSLNYFLDENPKLDFYDQNIVLNIISDNKRIDKLFIEDFLSVLLHSNKLINSNSLKSSTSINLFYLNEPKKTEYIPKYVNLKSISQL